jgi:hypothetical protein
MVQQKQNFSEDKPVNKRNSVNDDAAIIGEDQNQKPKRVLTEAQRLAFLKGREKRMANIERKRQEKLEAEDEEEQQTVDHAVEEPIKIVAKSEEKIDANAVEEIPIPKETKLEEPTPTMPVLRRHANSDETAKRIADLILERMELGCYKEDTIAPPPAKKSRGRPKTKEVLVRGPSSSESESSPSPPTSTPVYHPPQRVFNWM